MHSLDYQGSNVEIQVRDWWHIPVVPLCQGNDCSVSAGCHKCAIKRVAIAYQLGLRKAWAILLGPEEGPVHAVHGSLLLWWLPAVLSLEIMVKRRLNPKTKHWALIFILADLLLNQSDWLLHQVRLRYTQKESLGMNLTNLLCTYRLWKSYCSWQKFHTNPPDSSLIP